MIKVDSNKTIRLNRGDSGTLIFNATIEQTGDSYTFQIGDVVRLNVTKANKENEVVLSKDVTVDEEVTSIEMPLDSTDTKIGDVINRPITYWYDVELNPDANSTTIIGYDEDGPKLFILDPESSKEG